MRGATTWQRIFAGLVALFLSLTPAHADSWTPPETKSYVSANGEYRVTVVPRPVADRLAYFEAKARGEELPVQAGPVATLERREGSGWVVLKRIPLRNEVAPVGLVVDDVGRFFVTLDNWHSIGFGDHVVVIYDAGGTVIRSLRLDQIVPPYFVDGLPRSVSSIWWRDGEPVISNGWLLLRVADGTEQNDKPGTFPVRIRLADGVVEPLALDLESKLKPRFCSAHIREVTGFNAGIAAERANLVLPAKLGEHDLARYAHQAMRRLSTDKKGFDPLNDFPFELLAKGAYMAEDFRDSFRDALQSPEREFLVRWFMSADQDLMAREVQSAARKIKPGSLAGIEFYFIADGAHWPAIRDALAASGATLVQVDPTKPIPPRADDLARLPPDRVVDPACLGLK